MSRGNRRQPIFLADPDSNVFLELGRKVVEARRWTVHAFCLMPNHFHFVIETPDADLSSGMQALNGGYAQWFNRINGFGGHLFQGRFKAIPVESDWHLLELVRYIATNPSRAGLCPAPIFWQWSSYPALVRGGRSHFPPSKKLLGLFGSDETQARDALRRFVEDGL